MTVTKTNLRSQPSLFKKQTTKVVKIATKVTLQNLRLENPNRIMIGQLNINSIRNKFEVLTSLIADEIDVLLLSETKLNETFPVEVSYFRFCKTVKIR